MSTTSRPHLGPQQLNPTLGWRAAENNRASSALRGREGVAHPAPKLQEHRLGVDLRAFLFLDRRAKLLLPCWVY